MNDFITNFSITNKKRSDIWEARGTAPFTTVDWSNALAGEVGEVCNKIKKLRRLELNFQSTNDFNNKDNAIKEVAKEIADVYCYLDLLATHLKIDLKDAITSKFNEISDREKIDLHVDKQTGKIKAKILEDNNLNKKPLLSPGFLNDFTSFNYSFPNYAVIPFKSAKFDDKQPSSMNFGEAMKLVYRGSKLQRPSWGSYFIKYNERECRIVTCSVSHPLYMGYISTNDDHNATDWEVYNG